MMRRRIRPTPRTHREGRVVDSDETGDRASLEEQVEVAAQGERTELGECDDADKGEEDYGQGWRQV